MQYPHGLGEIVAAAAGLRVTTLVEYLDAESPQGRQELMVRGRDGQWRLFLACQEIPIEYVPHARPP